MVSHGLEMGSWDIAEYIIATDLRTIYFLDSEYYS